MNHYGFDPARYFSAPGLAWDAALQITKVKLELRNDSDMLLLIESGTRGGIAIISHRHDKPTMNIWELNSILLRIPNSSHI